MRFPEELLSRIKEPGSILGIAVIVPTVVGFERTPYRLTTADRLSLPKGNVVRKVALMLVPKSEEAISATMIDS